uniref:Uncharacterized protein n=1 Tax=Rhizophora mucronata TaxID=61149 RepID=A0A2P2QZE6_RHIMU
MHKLSLKCTKGVSMHETSIL